MILYLLDTNVVSEITKPKPHEFVLAWHQSIPDDQLAISAITIRELAYGVANAEKQKSAKAATYAEGLQSIRAGFEGRILAIDEAVALEWASLLAKQLKHIDDKGLVATAKVHNLILVSRNEDHVSGHGVEILNPFKKLKGASGGQIDAGQSKI